MSECRSNNRSSQPVDRFPTLSQKEQQELVDKILKYGSNANTGDDLFQSVDSSAPTRRSECRSPITNDYYSASPTATGGGVVKFWIGIIIFLVLVVVVLIYIR